MNEARYVYLTLPESTTPVLHVTIVKEHFRFKVTRDQLLALNAQIVDAMAKGAIAKEHAFDEQLALNLG